MWGFDLDMTAVRLLRREDGNWQEIAAEKIEGADIEERLMALVDRIDSGAAVHLFLPRDQILYTDVAVSTDTAERAEIEIAMEGATPYPLEDLDLDWEVTTPGTARVAAIALETLDEAVAFAEVRGVKVGGFSSLASPDDFPRLPAFTSHNILAYEAPEVADEPEFVDAPEPEVDNSEHDVSEIDTPEVIAPSDAPVQFASARTPTKPRPDAGSLAPVPPEAVAPEAAPEPVPTAPTPPTPAAPDAVAATKTTPVPLRDNPRDAAPVVQVEDTAPVMHCAVGSGSPHFRTNAKTSRANRYRFGGRFGTNGKPDTAISSSASRRAIFLAHRCSFRDRAVDDHWYCDVGLATFAAWSGRNRTAFDRKQRG